MLLAEIMRTYVGRDECAVARSQNIDVSVM